jgi:hypothetical protein
MKSRIRCASSPEWLKLMACAAPSIFTMSTWLSVWLATSCTRSGPGMSGSRSPSTASVGMCIASMRSSDGYCVSALNMRTVLGTPNRR